MRAWPARRLCAVVLLVSGLLLAGCSDDDEAGTDTATTPPIPVPEGVELTDPGASLAVGDQATAVYVASRHQAAVVSVAVTAIRRGSRGDFRGFTLGASASRSTPWYVDTVMRIVGEQKLGRAPVPLFGYDSEQTYFPAADIHGGLDECRSVQPPSGFGPGDRLRTCLVFFVPNPVRLEAIQLRPEKDVEPISWSIPDQPD